MNNTVIKSFSSLFLVNFTLTCLAVAIMSVIFNYPTTGIDDANIFFVYAKNLANGDGFVYNFGGERVEGFTSLLWVILCTIFFKISDNPELLIIILNISLVALSASIAAEYIKSSLLHKNESRSNWPWVIAYLMLLFSSPDYLSWSTLTLMENALWSTLLLAGTILVTKEFSEDTNINIKLIPLLLLLVLTRPESFLWAPLLVGILVIRNISAKGQARTLIEIGPSILFLFFAFIALTLFRIEYFGFPLPNTYYAKVNSSFFYNLTNGAKYIGSYFSSDPVVFLAVFATLFSALHSFKMIISRPKALGGAIWLPFIAMTGLVIPVLTGGDHFGSFRFYQYIYPILLLTFIYFVKFVLPEYIFIRVRYTPNKKVGSIILIVVFCTLFGLVKVVDWFTFQDHSKLMREFTIAKNGRSAGNFTENTFSTLQELPSIGVVAAGGFKYSYSGEVVDLMGLNNTLMAHSDIDRKGIKNHASFDKAAFYKLLPKIVLPKIKDMDTWQFSNIDMFNSFENKALKKIFYDEEFLNLYIFSMVTRTDQMPGKAVIGWFLKSYVSELEKTPEIKIIPLL